MNTKISPKKQTNKNICVNIFIGNVVLEKKNISIWPLGHSKIWKTNFFVLAV